MGKIIVRKVKGMSLKVKISLVLVFTMLFSTLMYQGWYKPEEAMAAAVRVRSATGDTGTNTAGSFNVTMAAAPANGNTMIAVISTRGTTANRVASITQTGATWQFVAEGTNTNGVTTEIWYAPNVQSGATGVTITLAANLRAAAVVVEYSGLLSANAVDKTAQNTGNSTNATTGTTATTTQAAELWIGGIGYINSSPTFGTIQNGFTQVATDVTTNTTTSNNVETYFLEKIVAATGAATTGGTISATAQWAGAIATFIAVRNTVAVATGTNPASVGVNPGDLNKTIDGFRMTASAGTPQVTAVTATVTNPNNLSSIKLYLDNGSTVGTYDAGDTLLATVATPGTTVDFTGLTQTPATTGTNYIIVGDIAGGATATQTVTAVVSDITVTAPDGLGAIADTSATLTINTVPVFAFSASNYNKTEGNSGTSTATITVTRSGLTTGTNTVNYATSNGTATTADSDYVAASGTLTFAAGVTSQTFTVTVNGDTKYEADETVNLTLSSPSAGAYLGSPSTATLTIVNDDPLPSVNFYLPTAKGIVQAGQALIPVRLTQASGSTVTVTYNTANGTATSPTNYTAVTGGTLTFNPGEVSKSIPITLIAGNNLTFTVTLSAPSNAILGTPVVNTVTILAKYPSTATTCTDCHGGVGAFADGDTRNAPANTFPGSHNAHVISAGQACSVCHVAPGGTNYAHRNELIEMATNINGDTGGVYGKGASWTQINPPAAFVACSNVYCHSQGTSKTSNTGETRTTTLSAPLATLNWGSPGACDSCHGYPPSYADGVTTWGAAKANSHQNHYAACDKCHFATTTTGTSITGTAQHADKTYDVTQGNYITFTYTYNAAGGTCNTVTCHRNNTAQWGVTPATPVLNCIYCHAAALTITSGPLANGTNQRSAVQAEFANTWSHKRSASGAVTNADCIVCHMEGDKATGKTNPTYHGDGYIQLRDPDTGTTIKEVTFGGSGAGSYTSGTNELKFAKFSRDLTKDLATDPNFLIVAAIQVNHCLKCHDADGAKDLNAQVPTSGTAMKPFGTTITGHVAPYNSNGNGNVVDVNSAFNTANASYHPILGKQNNSYTQGTMMNTPWQITKANGNNTSWGYLMSCWDCHALPADSGTITRTVTAHGAANTIRGGIRAAGTTAATNLCLYCHKTGYSSTAAGQHGTGSAFAAGNNNMTSYMSNCSYCHAYGPSGGTHLATATNRPIRGEDVHGFNDRTPGTAGSVFAGTGSRPYAFIRNILTGWAPNSTTTETITNPHTCTGSSTGNPCNNNMNNDVFTPGGTY